MIGYLLIFSFHELVKQMRRLSQTDNDRMTRDRSMKNISIGQYATTARAYGQSLCVQSLADSAAEKIKQILDDKKNNIKIDYNH